MRTGVIVRIAKTSLELPLHQELFKRLLID